MKLGMQTGSIQTDYGVDGTYRLIREAGFDAVDANIDQYFLPARSVSIVPAQSLAI